jgi:hypothetical protein
LPNSYLSTSFSVSSTFSSKTTSIFEALNFSITSETKDFIYCCIFIEIIKMAVVAPANQSPPYVEKESAYVSATSISRELDGSYLIVSPYTEDDHLLRLDSVEPQCQFIARALTVMQVLRPDYATSPYFETFNWPEVIAQLRQILTSNGHKWQEQKSQDDARRGGTGPAHREAAGSARHLYTDWNIERHALVIRDNAEEWEITPWSG